MHKQDVIDYFGGSQTRVAEFLRIRPHAVCQWDEVIPEARAWQLQAKTRGKLKVDEALYRDMEGAA